jgi:hypothetical protein
MKKPKKQSYRWTRRKVIQALTQLIIPTAQGDRRSAYKSVRDQNIYQFHYLEFLHYSTDVSNYPPE